MISFAALAVFSGLSLNLLLSFALGAAGTAGDKDKYQRKLPFSQLFIVFISVLFIWVIFSNIFPRNWRGFLIYFLAFPLSALLCKGLELLREIVLPRIFPNVGSMRNVYSAYTAYDGLVPVSLLVTLLLAWNFTSALVLSLFFAIGNLAAIFILNEIRRKSTLEKVPRFLRGSPLVLISMGLLSLVFTAAAGLFFKLLHLF